MTKRILVPVDGFPRAEAVGAIVADTACGSCAKVRLLHVVPEPLAVEDAKGRVVAFADQGMERLTSESLDLLRPLEVQLQRISTELRPNRVDCPLHTSPPRQGAFEPSHARKIGQHEPYKDGEDALAGDTGKGKSNADDDKGDAANVLEESNGNTGPGRSDGPPAFLREVIGRNAHDEERDHCEACETCDQERREDCAKPGSGEADAREAAEELDHIF